MQRELMCHAMIHSLTCTGNEKNDEACGCVYYVALQTDQATDALVRDLRAEIGLEPLPEARSHVTIAGIAPASGMWCT